MKSELPAEERTKVAAWVAQARQERRTVEVYVHSSQERDAYWEELFNLHRGSATNLRATAEEADWTVPLDPVGAVKLQLSNGAR
jgi:hypothetical protein